MVLRQGLRWGRMDAINRVPPHSLEAESSVLGSILLDNTVWEQLSDLHSAMFYRESHRKIYTAMAQLSARGIPIDLVTLVDELRSKNQLEDIGGISYLASLPDTVPTALYAEAYLKILQEKYVLRQLITTSGQIMQRAYNAEGSLEDLLDQSQKMILEINQTQKGKDFQTIGPVVDETFELITHMHRTGGLGDGLATGFHDLDGYIMGLQPGSLNILAARPSMGKTALALSIGQRVALHARKRVVVFSLEMPAVQLVLRMLCSVARLEMSRVRAGQLGDRDFTRVLDTAELFKNMPMVINDDPNLTVSDLRSKCRRILSQFGSLDLVIVDYLQLMQGGNSRGGGENRQQEISQISRGLKSIARELNIPILVLSQLSRAVEQRQNHRPMLSDLRESGSIEQDADLVMFIYRDEYYNKDSDQQGVAEIIIGKQRNGPVGTVRVQFSSNRVSFDNLNSDYNSVDPREIG